MTTHTDPLFCDTKLAQRIELAEVDLIRAANSAARRRQAPGFLFPVAGGVASFADHGSPYNKVTGLGFDGVPDVEELERVERAFASYDGPTQVELARLADPAIGALLTARGYRLESFENVLGRPLDGSEAPLSLPDVDIRRSRDDDDDETWLGVMADAAAHADTEGVPWHEEFPRAIYLQAMRDSAGPEVRRYRADRGGVLAGGAELRLVDGIAQFAGAATSPAHRRRGIQNALLAVRLADAAAEGCDLAVIVTQPGSKSHQNAQRRGFHLLYTRAILVKPAQAHRRRGCRTAHEPNPVPFIKLHCPWQKRPRLERLNRTLWSMRGRPGTTGWSWGHSVDADPDLEVVESVGSRGGIVDAAGDVRGGVRTRGHADSTSRWLVPSTDKPTKEDLTPEPVGGD